MTLIILFLTVLMDLIGFGMILPLIPFLGRSLGDPLMAGLLMAVYSLMQFIFNPFWGQASDKKGRRPIILISLLGASLSHLFFAFAGSFAFLFLARALAGLFGANISATMAAAADISTAKNRASTMGLIGAAFGLGFVIGPFFGGLLADMGSQISSLPPFGARTPALAASLICGLTFLMAYFYLPETRVIQPEDSKVQTPSRWDSLFKSLKTPVLKQAIYGFSLTSVAMALMEVSLFFWVKDQLDWTLSQASYGFAYVGVLIVFTQGFLVRKLVPQYGERKILILGLALFAAGLILIPIFKGIWGLGMAVTLISLGQGLTHPTWTAVLSLLSSQSNQGGTMGWTHSLSALGRVIGPITAGFIYKNLSMSLPFYLAGGLTLIGLFVILSLYNQLPDQTRRSLLK